MAVKWNSVIRQILLRGNFIAGDIAAVKATYEDTLFDDTHLTNNGAQYPFSAIVDSMLQALTLIVQAIGDNRDSEYRTSFRDFTNILQNGDPIPTIGATGGSRYGVISNVFDIDNNRPLTFQPRRLIQTANETHGRRKLSLYQYFTDDIVIEHTRPESGGVKAEIVAWDREAEREAMIDRNDNADCPLPDALLPVLEFGSFSYIWRDTFNQEQAVKNWNLFYPEINRIAAKEMAATELPAKQ